MHDLRKVMRDVDNKMRSRVPEIDVGAIAEWVGNMTNTHCICTLQSMQIEASPLPNLCRALESKSPKAAVELSDIEFSLSSFVEKLEGIVLVPKLLELFDRGTDQQKRLADVGLTKIVKKKAALADKDLRKWAQVKMGIDYFSDPVARAQVVAEEVTQNEVSEGISQERLAPNPPGTPVIVDGLTSAPQLNGLAARAVKFVEEAGRYVVLFPSDGSQKLVLPGNLRPVVTHKAKVQGKAGTQAQKIDVQGLDKAMSYSGKGEKDGTPHGRGKGIYPDGSSYNGEWDNGEYVHGKRRPS